jgi:hypothetical protein
MRGNTASTVLILVFLLVSCGQEQQVYHGSEEQDSLLVRTMPRTPLDVGLEFSNALGMNDPSCLDFLMPSLGDSLRELGLSPWQLFGRWGGFDSGGRLTEVSAGPDSLFRTIYHCTITRLDELPPVVRMDFALYRGSWLIEHIEFQLPGDIMDSLTVENQVALVLQSPHLRREMRIARMLLEDCRLDREAHWASWFAAEASGTDFADYIVDLSRESYGVLAESNVRVAGKLQLIQDRATFQVTEFPVELRELVAAWRELAYLRKAVLRANHESMQNLRQTGTWIQPVTVEEEARIAFLESVFFSVSNLVEERDTLSTMYPVLLTCGRNEPLENMLVNLDPHQLQQKRENDIGIPIWRALGVDMNGDLDPERILYWAGDLYLFLGTPTGYRLAWRSWHDYSSDFHSEFGTQTSPTGFRSVVLVGNSGRWEYELYLDSFHAPVFTRSAISTDSVSVEDDLTMESPLNRQEGIR